MIKAVFVDVDNTLLDFDKCAEKSIKLSAEALSVRTPDNIMQTFTPINNSLWGQVEGNTLSVSELYKIRFNIIFKEIGIEFDGELFERHFKKNLEVSAEKVDGAEELMRYLSEKYIVAIASNAPYLQQETRLKKAGLFDFVDKMFLSEEIGFSKPSEEFFRHCLNELSPITTQEVIMIGDSLSADISGAYKFGIQTCWFNIKGLDKSPDFADYTVRSLSEIKNII